uniref:Uncharacterized protein n=1 Tax=Trichogramma kaykai TaxID=54128 RepID=A0ABD2WHX8_9HYME
MTLNQNLPLSTFLLPAGRARGSGARSRAREGNTLQLLKKLRLPRGQNPHRRRFSLIVALPDYDDDDNQSRPLRVLYTLYILYGLDHVRRDTIRKMGYKLLSVLL